MAKTERVFSRVEVISPDGREFVYYGKATIDEQDNGKTLIAFVERL